MPMMYIISETYSGDTYWSVGRGEKFSAGYACSTRKSINKTVEEAKEGEDDIFDLKGATELYFKDEPEGGGPDFTLVIGVPLSLVLNEGLP